MTKQPPRPADEILADLLLKMMCTRTAWTGGQISDTQAIGEFIEQALFAGDEFSILRKLNSRKAGDMRHVRHLVDLLQSDLRDADIAKDLPFLVRDGYACLRVARLVVAECDRLAYDKLPARARRVMCMAFGWDEVEDSEGTAIVHIPTHAGLEHENDTVFSDWPDCYDEVIGE
jgi:hypothetical protein